MTLYEDFLSRLNADNICTLDTVEEIAKIDEPTKRLELKTAVTNVAKKLGMKRDFETIYKAGIREIARRNRGVVGGRKTKFTNQPVQLMCGEWECDDSGVRAAVFNKSNDDYEYQYACTIPIMPVELLSNANTRTERVRIAYAIGGDWRYITVDRLTIASNTRIVELSNNGIEVTSENARLLVRFMADMIAGNDLPRLDAVSHVGWHEDEFVPYTDSVRFDGEHENRSLFDSINVAGSRAKWVECMNSLIDKSKLFRLTMAASFASPLISRVHALPFVWHLWGGTGSGKTVATMCAMSIWGNPRLGAMTRTMNMTQNSMMATAAFLRDLPFAGDELQIIKEKFGSYDKLIMAVTEGVDRGRMSYNKNEPMKTWSCSFLFTGEDPVTHFSSGGGVINRVIEAEASERLVADGNGTVEFINANHGLVGEEYINALKSLGEDVKEMYGKYYASVLQCLPDTTDKKAQTAALMLTADLIASTYIFDREPMSLNDIIPLLKTADEVSISERAHTHIMDVIAMNANRFYGTDNDEHNNGEIWGKVTSQEVVINKNVLCRLLCESGFEFDSVKGDWAKRGYIRPNSQGKFMHQTKVAGVKANYVCLCT